MYIFFLGQILDTGISKYIVRKLVNIYSVSTNSIFICTNIKYMFQIREYTLFQNLRELRFFMKAIVYVRKMKEFRFKYKYAINTHRQKKSRIT